MTDHAEAIKMVMAMFLAEYGPSRFQVTKERQKLWEKMLCQFEPEIIVESAIQLLGTSKTEWPPVIGQLRDMALRLSSGLFFNPSPEEAWLRVMRWVTVEDSEIQLTEIERICLESVGGSHDLKCSRNIQADRATFKRVFVEITERERVEQLTSNNVKQLVSKQRKLLTNSEKSDQ